MKSLKYKISVWFKKLPNWPRPLEQCSDFGKFCQIAFMFMIFIMIFILFTPFATLVSIIIISFPKLFTILLLSTFGTIVVLWITGRRKRGMPRFKAFKLARKLCVALVFIWISMLFFTGICSFSYLIIDSNNPSSYIQFPLTSNQGLAVDDDGYIYYLTEQFNRVQIFSPDSKFIKGWFVDVSHTSVRLVIDDRGYLRVATSGGPNYYFNREGVLIETKNLSSGYFNSEFNGRFAEYTDNLGNYYSIPNPHIMPRVIKRTPFGEEQIILKERWGHWLMSIPIPGVVFVFTLLLMEERLKSVSEGVKSKSLFIAIIKAVVRKFKRRRTV